MDIGQWLLRLGLNFGYGTRIQNWSNGLSNLFRCPFFKVFGPVLQKQKTIEN